MDMADGFGESAALGRPTRCQLFASPDESKIFKERALQESLARTFAEQPQLAIDVGNHAISIIEPASKAVITSAGRAQVTATPAIYAPVSESSEGAVRQYKQPMLIVNVPGGLNPRIAIRPMRYSIWNGHQFRYAWRMKAGPLDVRKPAQSPTHVATETEWFSFVEAFGLAALVVDKYTSGKLDRSERFSKVYSIAFAALVSIATIAFFGWFAWAIITGNIHHH
jgi:hypothetical protein